LATGLLLTQVKCVYNTGYFSALILTPMRNSGLSAHKYALIVVLTTAILAFSSALTVPVEAQNNLPWSRPQRIPGYDNTAPDLNPPVLIADQNRTVHAFNSNWVADRLSIVYSQWRLDQGWTQPNDIILPPRGQARLTGALLDNDGFMHLTFWGGDDRSAEIYYTRANAGAAERATAWLAPAVVGPRAIAPTTAAVAGDGRQFLAILYSGNDQGRGLYIVYSLDAGMSWSVPEPVFLTYSNELWPTALNVFMDVASGRLHAVWTNANISGNGEAVYYTSFALDDNDELVWNEPLLLAEAIIFEADTAAIIAHAEELLVVYHNDSPTTRWLRRSQDNGQTWSEPVRLFDHVGSNGAASLVVDSAGQLHMLFGNRIGAAIHGMWHSTWDGNRWREPQAVISGPLVREVPGGNGFDPSFAQAVVSQGNVLLVTWRSDPAAGPNGIWYSFTPLQSPELAAVPLPEPASAELDSARQPVPINGASIDNGPVWTSENSAPGLPMTAHEVRNPVNLLLLGLLPVLFVIITAIAIHYWRFRSVERT
jgi:hypothetical protein